MIDRRSCNENSIFLETNVSFLFYPPIFFKRRIFTNLFIFLTTRDTVSRFPQFSYRPEHINKIGDHLHHVVKVFIDPSLNSLIFSSYPQSNLNLIEQLALHLVISNNEKKGDWSQCRRVRIRDTIVTRD